MKIFILEDDLPLLNAVDLNLRLKGFETIKYSDSLEAWNFLEITNEKIDVFLLDINMPHINGLQILTKIQMIFENPYIIMISANTDIESMKESYSTGCSDFIKKPFDIDEIILKIDHHFQKDLSDIIEFKNGITLNLKKRKISFEEVEENLTKKEFLLLELLLSKQDNIVNLEDIEQTVYEGETILPSTLRTLMSRLRKKLQDKDIIQTLSGIGFMISKAQIKD
jgi:DNA-binding response OmpR family regulator